MAVTNNGNNFSFNIKIWGNDAKMNLHMSRREGGGATKAQRSA